MENDISKTLAEFAVNTKYSEIPKEMIDFAKGLTLKTVAGMVVGADKPSGRKAANLIRSRNLAPEASILGHGFKTGLWEAVFLNAFLAHASELEDDSFMQTGGTGWDITVIPLLFPLAEKEKISGQALLESIVLGLEVHHRTCMFSGLHMNLGIITPAVGPAVAAARALGMGVKETLNAMGIATSGVNLWMANTGTDGHYFESAMQSMQGMMAADFAKEGMIGNSDIVSYLSRFLGEDKVAKDKMLEGLGRYWLFSEIWVKKYPSCFITHRPIDLVVELKTMHSLSYEDVETIEVHCRVEDDVCDRPLPTTDHELQFSLQHTLATAMLDGDVNLDHFTEKAVNDPRLIEARKKVKVVPHPELSGKGFLVPIHVVIKTKDGREFTKERVYAIGSPKEPLTIEQFEKLYRKFTRDLLPDSEISKTAELIMNLEKLSNISELAERLGRRYKNV